VKPNQVHAATLRFNDEEHIQPRQTNGLHREEIAGKRSRGLRTQKLRPAAAHRCRGHRHAEVAALPGDAQVAHRALSRASRGTSSTTSGSSPR
jgi:hypothetical protein